MRRLLLIAAVVASAAPAAHAAGPVACVRTVNGKGVHFDVCVPVGSDGVTACTQVLRSPSPSTPDVYVCVTP